MLGRGLAVFEPSLRAVGERVRVDVRVGERLVVGHADGDSGGNGVGFGRFGVHVGKGFVGADAGGAAGGAVGVTEALLHDGAEEGELPERVERDDGLGVGDVSNQLVAEAAEEMGLVEEVEGDDGQGPRGGECPRLNESLALLAETGEGLLLGWEDLGGEQVVEDGGVRDVELPLGRVLGRLDGGDLLADGVLHLQEAAPARDDGGRDPLREGRDEVQNNFGVLDDFAVVGSREEVVCDIPAVVGVLGEMVALSEGILVDDIVGEG